MSDSTKEQGMNPVPKFIENQVVWEQDYDINKDALADARLGVVQHVEWGEKGWMVTVQFPDWPTAAVEEWERQMKLHGGVRGSGYQKAESVMHENAFRALTPPEYRAP